MRELTEVIKYLAQSMVDHPEQVRVAMKRGAETTFYIHVAEGEEGRLIGKGGRVIQAIRMVAKTLNSTRYRVQVDIATKK